MIANTQSYLQQIKEINLLELVQSQSFQILNQIIQIYHDEGTKLEKINSVNDQGFSPLHKACARGIPEIVELLLMNGANPNMKNIGGETAAHMAAKRGSPIILHILKSYNADVEELDNKGQNIAHCAVMIDSVLVLLWIETSTEISLKFKDCNGITPLHLSCILGKTNCMKFFLRKAYDINERTMQRDNCLHLAIKHRQLQCVPILLFNSSKTTSFCDADRDMNKEKSSILLSKNSDNKTPVELYHDLPDGFKDKNRYFSYLFFLIRMSTLKQMELNLHVYRYILFFFPFVSFLIGVLLAVNVWPDYRTVIFPITSVFCAGFVCCQSHRISQLDSRENPVFAGAFLSGVLHDLLCFKINIYPSVKNDWEIVLVPFLVPIFAVCYLRLILVNPGQLLLSEVSTADFSTFLTREINEKKLNNCPNKPVELDRFCQVCEAAPNVERVKHCKLCNICVVNIDHHCLFLMKCIARNNTRNFIFLIIFSLALIGLFVEVSLKTIILDCGPLSGASPLPYLYCSYTKQTWVSTGVVINGFSLLWGFAILYNQLRMISFNSTFYYQRKNQQHQRHHHHQQIKKKIYRVIYFLIKGRYYVSNEERQILSNI